MTRLTTVVCKHLIPFGHHFVPLRDNKVFPSLFSFKNELIMKNVNLKNQLTQIRNRREASTSVDVLDEVYEVLHQAYCAERDLMHRMTAKAVAQSEFSWAALDAKQLFTTDDIKQLCIQYRLRFLDASKFKGDIPFEAVTKTKDLEQRVGVEFTHFKIVAPDDRFRLEDCDKDPLLFIRLSDRYYYLVHQWGNDMKWYRKLLVWPMRSFTTLGATIGMLSLLLSMLIPTQLIVGSDVSASGYARLALFFWFLVSISSIVTYIGFAFFKNVTVNQWNSPFFKQDF
jgi:hypothetical protein